MFMEMTKALTPQLLEPEKDSDTSLILDEKENAFVGCIEEVFEFGHPPARH